MRERVTTTRSLVLLVDLTGSMSGERARTAAAAVGALAPDLARDNLAVIAFWSDPAALAHLGRTCCLSGWWSRCSGRPPGA